MRLPRYLPLTMTGASNRSGAPTPTPPPARGVAGRRTISGSVRLAGIAVLAAAGLALAGCSSVSVPPTGSGGTVPVSGAGGNAPSSAAGDAANCSEPCVVFHVAVDFTGADAVQGAFVDNSSGSGWSTCAAWASTNTPLGLIGPGTPTQSNTMISGKSVSFLFEVPKSAFHGPGTYPGALAAGVTIGSDTFFAGATDSSETIHGDGSGSASFTNLSGTPANPESGTLTWTCSA